MRNYIENLKDKMVRSWGFEHPATIRFFKWCEDWEDVDNHAAANLEFLNCNCEAINELLQLP